jgi:predicted xylose isomerase-like sugar epimerase
MANPDANSVRNLASRYHLSIKRVDAILRLKGLEENWIKVSTLSLISLARVSGRMMFIKISLEDTNMVIP